MDYSISKIVLFENDNHSKRVTLDTQQYNFHGIQVQNHMLLFESTPIGDSLGAETLWFSDHPILRDIFKRYGSSLAVTATSAKGERRKWHIIGDKSQYFLPWLVAYGCYHGFITGPDTWIAEYEQLKQYRDRTGLNIDHADGLWQNNTLYNLSFMPKAENGSKSNIVEKINHAPFDLAIAYVNKKYRMHFQVAGVPRKHMTTWQTLKKCCLLEDLDISNNKDILFSIRMVAEDAMKLNTLLRDFIGRFVAPWLNINEPMYRIDRSHKRWFMSDTESSLANISESIKAQYILALMPKEAFEAEKKESFVG